MDRSSTLLASLRNTWPALLVLGVLVLLPVARSAEAPLTLAALAGLVLAWRRRRELSTNASVRLAGMLFACYWLPTLISAFDSVNSAESWKTVATLLRFLPFAAFVCLTLCETAVWQRIVHAVAAIVALWLLDAWVQALTGYGIAGAPEAERLTGIFGAGHPKLGPALAILSPFVLIAALTAFGRRGLIVAFVFLLVPILLAGSRAAWIMYALVALVFAWRETRVPLRFFAWSATAAALVALVAVVAQHDSAGFSARVDRTLRVLQGSEQSVDEAAAGRLQIWGTDLRMIAAHPINGVGVRAFRYAYPQYAQANDSFVNRARAEGAYHAHNLVLEVLTETGTIGLLLWSVGVFAAIRAWRRALPDARSRALAPGLALAVMCFPLNTYFAFYSAEWGLFFWWLLALYCAALYASDADVDAAGAAHAAHAA